MPKFDEKFVDPRTGENVTRVKVPDKYKPDIEKHVQANAMHANNFMQLARQEVQIQKKKIEEFDKATESEQGVGKEVIKIREKMGLDSGWIYNIPLSMMEKREPPTEEGTIDNLQEQVDPPQQI